MIQLQRKTPLKRCDIFVRVIKDSYNIANYTMCILNTQTFDKFEKNSKLLY